MGVCPSSENRSPPIGGQYSLRRSNTSCVMGTFLSHPLFVLLRPSSLDHDALTMMWSALIWNEVKARTSPIRIPVREATKHISLAALFVHVCSNSSLTCSSVKAPYLVLSLARGFTFFAGLSAMSFALTAWSSICLRLWSALFDVLLARL